MVISIFYLGFLLLVETTIFTIRKLRAKYVGSFCDSSKLKLYFYDINLEHKVTLRHVHFVMYFCIPEPYNLYHIK